MNRDSILKEAYELLPARRRRHTEGVRETAIRLAKLYGEDPDKAELAAVCHDMMRIREIDRLNELIDAYGIAPRYKGNPALAHSKLAAAVMRKDFGIDDPDLLNAVCYHTTGRAGMSRLEMIIYLADAIEPSRDYPGVEEIRRLAENDLEEATRAMLEHSVTYVREAGQELDPDSLAAIRYLNRSHADIDMKEEKRMDSKQAAYRAAEVLDAKKGEEIVIINVAEKSSFADYMVVATGRSSRQVAALADDVEDALAADGYDLRSVDGKNGTGWVLLDFGDVIINVFERETRERYNIEKVWGDCPTESYGKEE